MIKKKKLQYLIRESLTDDKLDPQKIAVIITQLSNQELRVYYKMLMGQYKKQIVEIHSTVDLPQEAIEKLKDIFKNKDLLFMKDPRLIAGLKLQFEDNIYDASFKAFFEKMKEEYN